MVVVDVSLEISVVVVSVIVVVVVVVVAVEVVNVVFGVAFSTRKVVIVGAVVVISAWVAGSKIEETGILLDL